MTAPSLDNIRMGDWRRIDALEQQLLAESAPASLAQPKPSLWHRIRGYLPGSNNTDKWAEPSAIVYFHQVHVCVIQ